MESTQKSFAYTRINTHDPLTFIFLPGFSYFSNWSLSPYSQLVLWDDPGAGTKTTATMVIRNIFHSQYGQKSSCVKPYAISTTFFWQILPQKL